MSSIIHVCGKGVVGRQVIHHHHCVCCVFTYREVYELCSPGYKGRCTAPVMIDKKTRKIINNESSDLIRILNHLSPADPAKEYVFLLINILHFPSLTALFP